MLALNLLTAMITPYNEDLTINYARAEEIASYLADNGSDAVVVSGTTGESPVLSPEEKLELFTRIKNKIGDRIQVWAGTGSYNTAATVELTRQAEKTGVDGIMIVTPYYNKPSQEGLYQHFKTVAESTSLPIMLYNVPGRTVTNLLPETIARLAQIDNIVAVKEASGNMDQVSLLKSLIPEETAIYSGDDSLTLPLMAIGAVGVVSIASHLVGKDIKAMIESFLAGDVVKAREIHQQLFPLFKGLFITTNPVPVKEALNLIGMECGGFRLPLCSASPNELDFLKNLLRKYDLLK